MCSNNSYRWLLRSSLRKRIVQQFSQPMTAHQWAVGLGRTLNACNYVLWELAKRKVVFCLNPSAKRSRVYWLSGVGVKLQRRLRRDNDLPVLKHDFPQVNWDTYGWVCFSHRSTAILTLKYPMQASAMKRKACFENPRLRMGCDNARRLIRSFHKKGIVRQVWLRKRAFPLYELTELGTELSTLLFRAKMPPFSI